MTTRMQRTTHTRNADLLAHDFEVTKHVSLAEFAAITTTKDQRVFVWGKMTPKQLAKLNAHWYESLFIALSFNLKRQVVKIHVLARQCQKLLYPEAGIKSRERKGMQARLRSPDGLPVYQSGQLLRAKGG
jgi:hypothetical protein